MVVPEGYKKTAVGIIPQDWECTTISEAFEICNNLRYPISDVQRKNMQGQYPYYGPTQIQGYINEYRIEGEYALIGEDGDHFLKYSRMPMTQFASGRFNVNNHAHLIRGSKGNLAKWFYYYYRNRNITLYLTRQGAGRYKLNKATLENLHIALPNKEEQSIIVEALSDMDGLITSFEKLIDKKRTIKYGAMQALLTGKRRLAGFNGEWKLSTVGEICLNNIQKGEIITKSSIVEGDIPVIAGGKEAAYYHNVANRNANTITISASGANAGYVAFHTYPIFASDCSTIEESSEYDVKYIYYCLLLNQAVIYSMQTGGAQPHIHPYEIKKVIVYDMNIVEQKAISGMLSDLDAEIEQLKRKLEKYYLIRMGMMQELLTGRIRLAVPSCN